MKIEHVQIENFKGIDSADFKPAKINVFLGKNGSGKTSYLTAIRTLITGDVKSPIRRGKDEAVIEGTIMGDDIKRSFKDKKNEVYVEGKKTTQKALLELLEGFSGTKLDTMKMMTSSALIASIKSGELADFLAGNGLIPVKLDWDILKAFMVSLKTEALDELELFFPSMPKKFGITEIELAYDEYFAQRKIAKKELQEKQALAKWDKPVPARTLDLIDKEISLLNSEAQAERAYLMQLDIYNKEVERRKNMLEEVAKLEEKMKTLKAVEPDANKRKGYDDLLRTFDATLQSTAKSKTLAKVNVQTFTQMLENLSKPVCPLSDKLICSTDKTAVREDIQKSLDANQKDLERLETEEREILEKKAKVNELIQEYNKEYEEYQNAKAVFDKHKLLKGSIPTLPDKPVEPVKKENVAERIRLLQEERKDATAYALSKEAGEMAAKLEERIELISTILDELRPKGNVYSQVMRYALGHLETWCNNRAKMLKKDFELGIDVTEGLQITCKASATGSFVPLHEASSGEQLLAMFLLMDMINSLSGNFKILLIDDLDKLDEGAMDGFLNLLTQREIMDTYDHMFIAAVDHEDTVKAVNKHIGSLQLFNL